MSKRRCVRAQKIFAIHPHQLNRVCQESRGQDHNQYGRRVAEVVGKNNLNQEQNHQQEQVQTNESEFLALKGTKSGARSEDSRISCFSTFAIRITAARAGL